MKLNLSFTINITSVSRLMTANVKLYICTLFKIIYLYIILIKSYIYVQKLKYRIIHRIKSYILYIFYVFYITFNSIASHIYNYIYRLKFHLTITIIFLSLFSPISLSLTLLFTQYPLNKEDSPTCDLRKVQSTIQHIIVHNAKKYIANRLNQLNMNPSPTKTIKKRF